MGTTPGPSTGRGWAAQMPELLRAGTIMPGGRRTRTRVKPGAGRQWGQGLGRCPDCAPSTKAGTCRKLHKPQRLGGRRGKTCPCSPGPEGRLEEGRPEEGKDGRAAGPLSVLVPGAQGLQGSSTWGTVSGPRNLGPQGASLSGDPRTLQWPHILPHRNRIHDPEDRPRKLSLSLCFCRGREQESPALPRPGFSGSRRA